VFITLIFTDIHVSVAKIRYPFLESNAAKIPSSWYIYQGVDEEMWEMLLGGGVIFLKKNISYAAIWRIMPVSLPKKKFNQIKFNLL